MLARLTHPDGRHQLVFTRTLRHAPEKVWRALTEPEHLAAWFPHEIRGGWDVGAVLGFAEGDGNAAFSGEVLVYDPPKLLEFTWGTDALRFELEPLGEGCVLTLTDTFDELGKGARDAAGWDTCLDLLEAGLDGVDVPWEQGERWTHWHEQYVAALPAEATTIGPPEGHELA
jgi:uncharacterized protein YndB with AHSA1/START domain